MSIRARAFTAKNAIYLAAPYEVAADIDDIITKLLEQIRPVGEWHNAADVARLTELENALVKISLGNIPDGETAEFYKELLKVERSIARGVLR